MTTVATGRFNDLTVVRRGRAGFYVDGGDDGEILILPQHAPADCRVGDTLSLFIFVDADGRLVATPRAPLAQVGEVGWLRVVSLSAVGAFLDWGMPKDLLLPHGEQRFPPEAGKHVLAMVFRDARGRVAASTRLDDFIRDEAEDLRAGDEVTLVISDRTTLGFKAVVNHRFWGLLYSSDLPRPLRLGERVAGYVRRVREDGRLDLSLTPVGVVRLEGAAADVLARLQQAGGVMPLGDKSSPEAIRAATGLSKNAFRQAIGMLYRQRLIILSPHEIRLPEA
ncbi:hypothetical protein S7S_12155 [Isoalcanivorax pacificus W11-5]|uniref:S1 motif domain-containing protein n=1 Tax=Isoalcanivorax pacificus W11-5 TaxID=391936 RepID=A0A0B4XQX9_9GAMM|nr:S1-like domain-containing RNA-binding protein [Isoalcanivorax pacificus]AJD48843.1 hypothetical protein S7S_12155 [Isoalcanivorax pacificus W11-5]